MARVDVGKLLVGYFTVHNAGMRHVTKLPANLADVLPLVRFQRVSGGDSADAPNLETVVVDTDLFDADEASAEASASSVHGLFRRSLPHTTINGQTVGRVECPAGFRWLPWDDTTIWRLSATYTLYIASLT